MRDYQADTELFERTEELLYAWGRERRKLTEGLGLPTQSSIAVMIERQKVFEQRLAGATRRRKRKRRDYVVKRLPNGRSARLCAVCGLIYLDGGCKTCAAKSDPDAAARELGHAPTPLTARGTETRSSRAPLRQLSASAVQVQAAIERLPGWMRRSIYRYYAYGQHDRHAARDLHMTREVFTKERVASVVMLAGLLAHAYGDGVRSVSPSRAVGEPPSTGGVSPKQS